MVSPRIIIIKSGPVRSTIASKLPILVRLTLNSTFISLLKLVAVILNYILLDPGFRVNKVSKLGYLRLWGWFRNITTESWVELSLG